ncbi:BBE domain-containing protein, partial [Francisellaceae bacterium]|nr:BBE domain-containing protein [Francisellaceae bacterium]
KSKLKVLISEDKLNAFFHTSNSNEIAELWNLRKKGVGLLGNMKGDNKPIPFMEDTAVPPENLADYIVDLRKLLDSYDLKYGMFGHVDVGCLHMRPALDMSTESHQKLIPVLTKQVNELVRKYGGVYWSEHGKGFRSEYVQQYFGDKLYDGLAEIKQTFDPNNRLNPGKIVVPKGSKDQLVKVDGPYKGYVDTKVDKRVRQKYAGAFNCNGNAACLNYDYNDVICPSAKLSRNWVYSPKGRSGLLREWLHQLSNKKYIGILASGEPEFGHQIKSWFKRSNEQKNDYSHEVYESMEKCLGCKACASSCPVKVDIPTMRSHFLSQYHTRYRRPVKDYFIAMVEKIAHYQSYVPTASNTINQLQPVRWVMDKFVGLKDLPRLSTKRLNKSLITFNAPKFDIQTIKNLSDSDKAKSVCLIQDAFNGYYQSEVMIDTYELLTNLGFNVYVLPFRENGKALHTKGFIKHFTNLARENTVFYNRIAEIGLPIIGIEPSMTLCYRDEYVKTLGAQVKFHVQLINEWLAENLDKIDKQQFKSNGLNFDLYPHCSERALALESNKAWQKIFSHFGIQTKVAKTGCCGMAGTYGHESKHVEGSKKLYDMSWKESINNSNSGDNAIVTGFSCRCQVKRMEGKQVNHPVTVLNSSVCNQNG